VGALAGDFSDTSPFPVAVLPDLSAPIVPAYPAGPGRATSRRRIAPNSRRVRCPSASSNHICRHGDGAVNGGEQVEGQQREPDLRTLGQVMILRVGHGHDEGIRGFFHPAAAIQERLGDV